MSTQLIKDAVADNLNGIDFNGPVDNLRSSISEQSPNKNSMKIRIGKNADPLIFLQTNKEVQLYRDNKDNTAIDYL